MSSNLTILGQAFYEAQAEAQQGRDLAAINSMLQAFGADDANEPVGAAPDAPDAPQAAPVAEPPEPSEPAPEASQPATESVPPAKKSKAKAARQESVAVQPYFPVDVPVFGSTELPKALVIGMLDTSAVLTMTKIMGDPVSLVDKRATWGNRERISLRTDIDGRGHWNDAAVKLSGSHFHELLAHLLGLNQDKAIEVGFALANGEDLDKARVAIERKIGKGQAAGFLSIWEAAVPLRQSLAMRALRNQLLDVRFSNCDFSDLRGESQGNLLGLHRDPQSNGAVGLTVFNPKGEAIEAHGDTLAPVALQKNWQERARVVIAETMRRALYMAAFTSPVLWLPQLHARTMFPKLPSDGKTYLVALNATNTGELGALQTRHGRDDLKLILPQESQVFP